MCVVRLQANRELQHVNVTVLRAIPDWSSLSSRADIVTADSITSTQQIAIERFMSSMRNTCAGASFELQLERFLNSVLSCNAS